MQLTITIRGGESGGCRDAAAAAAAAADAVVVVVLLLLLLLLLLLRLLLLAVVPRPALAQAPALCWWSLLFFDAGVLDY